MSCLVIPKLIKRSQWGYLVDVPPLITKLPHYREGIYEQQATVKCLSYQILKNCRFGSILMADLVMFYFTAEYQIRVAGSKCDKINYAEKKCFISVQNYFDNGEIIEYSVSRV